MSDTEGKLIADLATLDERLADEQFRTELYRALAGGHLTKDGAAIAPSWQRAEDIVNRLRPEEPLSLAQSGAEGERSDDVASALDQLGWRWRPRDTSTRDTAHQGRAEESPPPPDAGERHAPVSDSGEWERQAHEEADRARFGRPGAPSEALPGTGAGGGEAPRVGGS